MERSAHVLFSCVNCVCQCIHTYMQVYCICSISTPNPESKKHFQTHSKIYIEAKTLTRAYTRYWISEISARGEWTLDRTHKNGAHTTNVLCVILLLLLLLLLLRCVAARRIAARRDPRPDRLLIGLAFEVLDGWIDSSL